MTHKEYPTIPGTGLPNERGLRWVELKNPEPKMEGLKSEYLPEVDMWRVVDKDGGVVSSGATEREAIGLLSREDRRKMLEDALKYEGETMGHCVGGPGYCADVAEGRSRIFSLRDKKGQPHVTIEVSPKGAVFSDVAKHIGEDEANRLLDQGMTLSEMIKTIPDFKYPQRIKQIKGKANLAPNEEYLPYVQDFVKSGKWSDVGDLSNAGMQKVGDKYLTLEEVKAMSDRSGPLYSMTGAPIATGIGAGYNANQPEPSR